ncbi:MAG: DUF2231 domain-containing protein [Leptolyngbyaceae cyanobacterium CRU_2_3]|nr:DUF2231 domain-containing protein [Acaryochloris sp. RU_4_1]NJR64620.1 DUF2231 domain-containing protein [Leptolyngbyaceae cyanobacterium CRU_2_3]
MVRIQNREPSIESENRDYYDSGIPSKVAIAGHPLHPLLVTFPITFLVTALGTDLGFWLTNDLFWARVSFWLIGAGLGTAVLAAIAGLVDFFRIGRVRKRKAGWFHLIGNVAVLIITVINFVLRWGNPTQAALPTGLVLSIFVSTLLGITGWYGGELVYRHKIAVVGEGESK